MHELRIQVPYAAREESGVQWRNIALRAGPWCGIFVPGLDALVNGVVAAVQPNYDFLRDYISDLSAPDVAYSGLIRGWWIAFPFLFAPFAASVFLHLRRGKARWGPLLLLLGFACGLGMCGIFHCDVDCRGRTLSAKMHFVFSYLAAASLYFSPLALAIASRGDENWRGFQPVNVACLIFGAAAGLALFLAEESIIPYRGLCERLYFGVFYVWVVMIALRLLRWANWAA